MDGEEPTPAPLLLPPGPSLVPPLLPLGSSLLLPLLLPLGCLLPSLPCHLGLPGLLSGAALLGALAESLGCRPGAEPPPASPPRLSGGVVCWGGRVSISRDLPGARARGLGGGGAVLRGGLNRSLARAGAGADAYGAPPAEEYGA